MAILYRHFVTFVFLSLLFFPCSAQENSHRQRTTISVYFSGIHELSLNRIDNNMAPGALYFRNPTHGDTLVKKYLDIAGPTHLYYANASFNPATKEFTQEMGSLLVLPGDSLVLDQNGFHLAYSPYYGQFIDQLINLEGLYTTGQNKLKSAIVSKGLPNLLAEISTQYQANEKKIDQYFSAHPANTRFVGALRNLNWLLRARRIGGFAVAEPAVTIKQRKLLDGPIKDIMQSISKAETLSSSFTFTIPYYLVTYNALIKGKKINDFWDYFTMMDSKLLNTAFYRSFLLNRLYLGAKGNIDQLRNTIDKIKRAGITDHRYDSLLSAKLRVSQDKDNQLASQLKNPNGVYLNYFDLINSLKGHYIFIDFWATWCGPCRLQMPYLNKLKKEFADRIKFISISIDEDDAEEEWTAAAKDEGIFNEPFNYRLQHGSHNRLLKILEFEAVPRYLVYGPDGKLLSADFTTPDKPNFRDDLFRLIGASN